MCNSAFDSMLCRRQCLPQHLTTKHLRTANIAAIAAKDVFFDAFELEELYEIVENRMHSSLRAGAPTIDKYARATDEHRIVAREE